MELLIRYFIALFFMLGVLFLWFLVQRYAREFASEHPEFGPAREEGGGCGGGGKCNCGSIKNCTNPKIKHKTTKRKISPNPSLQRGEKKQNKQMDTY